MKHEQESGLRSCLLVIFVSGMVQVEPLGVGFPVTGRGQNEAHMSKGKAFAKFGCKPSDGALPRAVARGDESQLILVERLDSPFQLSFRGKTQVSPPEDCVDPRIARFGDRMIQNVDESRVRTAKDDHETSGGLHDQGVIVQKRIGDPVPILTDHEFGVSRLELRHPGDFPRHIDLRGNLRK